MKGSGISSTATASGCSAPPERFRLTGPTVTLDRRVNAIRPDIADVALADRFFAPHYAATQPKTCVAVTAPLLVAPSDTARAVSELRRGDGFSLLDQGGGWAWGYCADDRYVGYVRADAIGDPSALPSHVVAVRSALVFAAPDIKSPPVATWPMGVKATGTVEGDFIAVDAGFVHHRQLRPIQAHDVDPAAVAERLLGTPYRWGGRSGGGIDCSGLVQLALGLSGRAAPRDSDQQRETVGEALADELKLRRNDLVFFPGHVGIMADESRLIHANAFWMAVTIEPLADVVARGANIVARRRIIP